MTAIWIIVFVGM